MASKRFLKKDLNMMVYDIVEECYTVSMFEPQKTEKADKIIDQAADFQEDMLAKVHTAKNNKDFAVIRKQIETKADDFVDQLNKLK